MPDHQDISTPEDHDAPVPGRIWMARGARAAISIPALILTAAFVGYAGLARGSGLSLPETLMMTGLVWALPSIVVLTGAISSGVGLVPAAIAVALASVRLMPMTMALIPMVKVEGKTKRWQLLYISHFVAVTAWVYGMRNLPDLPREGRLPFFAGFGTALTSFVFCMTGVAYLMVERMPPVLSGALFLLTPIYFVCSLWSASKLSADKAAMIVGLILGPFFYLYAPGLDLLWTGLVGGTIAYLITRYMRRGLL
ncbi:AzlC family ABC transporter permease [Roseibium sp.]|uniref:AzlC family ABC transporter permease n=1 Tax=Roseibium sp. TaxID=1936156 RepID=UPI0032641094